jgi:hypothetical protein
LSTQRNQLSSMSVIARIFAQSQDQSRVRRTAAHTHQWLLIALLEEGWRCSLAELEAAFPRLYPAGERGPMPRLVEELADIFLRQRPGGFVQWMTARNRTR